MRCKHFSDVCTFSDTCNFATRTTQDEIAKECLCEMEDGILAALIAGPLAFLVAWWTCCMGPCFRLLFGRKYVEVDEFVPQRARTEVRRMLTGWHARVRDGE